MTQEELDAMMAGDLDDIEEMDTSSSEEAKDATEEIEEVKEEKIEDISYRVSSDKSWPPPPPTEDHKMVHQLDDVTRDSEIKATQIFDKLESINNSLMDGESGIEEFKNIADYNLDIFEKLSQKFPNVKTFEEAIAKNKEFKDNIDNIVSTLQMGEDEVMMAMDIMQYQDIHRQKIERVINVMRALSKYMNSLFEGRIEDEKRVSSAVHIEGDKNTENVVSNEDIEALIESLGDSKK